MKNSVGFACTAHKGARYLQSGETVSTVLPREQVTSMSHHFCSILYFAEQVSAFRSSRTPEPN
jgi:hypothetical protein